MNLSARRLTSALSATTIVTLLLVSLTATPAQAAISWSSGVGVSSFPKQSSVDLITGARWAKYPKCRDHAAVAIKLKGDTMWVLDKCADGHAAIGSWKDKKSGREYICRNTRGYKTVVKCTFDWPERSGSVLAGTAKNLKVTYRDYGNMFFMTQSGGSCQPSRTTPC